jgi:PhnB protein
MTTSVTLERRGTDDEEMTMSMTLNPYLSFRGQAREALELYQSVLGGELAVTTFAEGMPDAVPADEQHHLMHGQLVAPGGIVLMAADVPSSTPLQEGSAVSISLSGDDEAALTACYEKISAVGTVVEPLAKAPWGDSFGMADDPFGVHWMFNIGSAPG